MQNGEYDYVELECPNCQAPLRGRSGANIIVCEYCGSQVHVRRRDAHSDGAVPVRDSAGRVLVHTIVPFDWDVTSAVLDPSAGSGEWPFLVKVELSDNIGSYIRYSSPLEFAYRGATMEQMMASYGNAATSALEPRRVAFPTPAEYYLEQVREQIGSLVQSSHYVGQLPHPLGKTTADYEATLGEQRRRYILDLARSKGVSVSINDIYVRSLARAFAFQMDGRDYRIAIYATILADKTTLQLPGMMGLGAGFGGMLGGLGSGLGNMLGGIFGSPQQSHQPPYQQQYPQQQPYPQQPYPQQNGFVGTMVDKGFVGGMIGNRIKENRGYPQQGFPQQNPYPPQANYPQQGYPAQQPYPQHMQEVSQMMPGIEDDARAAQFRQQSPSQDIGWQVLDNYVLITPAEKFDEFYRTIFSEVIANTKLDSFLMQQKEQFMMNGQMNLDASVRDFQQRSNQIAQQSLEYSRQQNAMMDARMESWQRQSDAHHKAVMDRGHAMFSDSPGNSSSMSDKWSEAILGQNTYVDQYGDEHTVSNRWDEAWVSDSGDVIGTERGVDPGSGWTKLDRKQ